MASNFKANGKTLRHVAAADIVSGQPIQVGGLAGVALSDIASGDTDELSMEGVFEFDKKAATAMAQGDLVEWDNGAPEVVPDGDAAGDFDLGYVWKTAAAADAKVEVRLLRK